MNREPQAGTRPTAVGKFLHVAGRRQLVKGVAYGTFAPDADGYQFPAPTRVADDLRTMRQFGINTIRTYTVPRPDLLDEAARHDLHVMVGVPWAQHIAFLDDRSLCRQIRRDVANVVRTIGAHPATLLTAIGNEIPQGIVRWHGRRRVECFLREVYEEAKSASPDALLTYVNYPPTEYLDLPFLDVCAFNVYLHREPELRAYLARLQHIAGHLPLLLTEAGADSYREGEEGQASLTAMQIRSAFEEGACGAVAFSWTDDWWRGGWPVEDWACGLTDVERKPKPALKKVGQEFAEPASPSLSRGPHPKVSVVVCAYNANGTIDECLTALGALNYPDYEVIVVNDGSRDGTSEIAHRHAHVRVVDIENVGLAAARNVGHEQATGEIVAYTDADVRVDPDWLNFLVQPFLQSDVVGVGGPNVVPADDPWMAQCTARSPGGPTHVMFDDRRAEHIPGCNMAFRRAGLSAIGGFNPIYICAGDDVDICWRLQAEGHTIGFAPAALVWHRHRPSLKAYWRQQVGYGMSETWLMQQHPEKYLDGRARWHGRIYSPLPFIRSISRSRVNAGSWGTAAFPSVYHLSSHCVACLPAQARWQALSGALVLGGAVALLTPQMTPAILLLGVGGAGMVATLARCVLYSSRSDIDRLPRIDGLSLRASRLLYRTTIAAMHFLQPLARAGGRVWGMLSPPGTRTPRPIAFWVDSAASAPSDWASALKLLSGGDVEDQFWNEQWIDRTDLLKRVANRLRASRVGRTVEVDDGWQERYDVRVGLGRWGTLDLSSVVEEHDAGRCLARMRTRLRMTALSGAKGVTVLAAVGGLFTMGFEVAAMLLMAVNTGFLFRLGRQVARTVAAARRVTRDCVAEAEWSLAQPARRVDSAPSDHLAVPEVPPLLVASPSSGEAPAGGDGG